MWNFFLFAFSWYLFIHDVKLSLQVRFLKDKLKRQKDESGRAQDEVKRKDLEMLKLRDKVKKYEEIMKEKRLDERDRLQQKLEKLEAELFEKEGKVLVS